FSTGCASLSATVAPLAIKNLAHAMPLRPAPITSIFLPATFIKWAVGSGQWAVSTAKPVVLCLSYRETKSLEQAHLPLSQSFCPLHTAHYLSFKVDRLNRANRIASIRNRKTIFDSFQSCISKWWCNGVILNNRRPVPVVRFVILNTLTCNITETASITNTPPTINNMNSCFVSTATVPIAPPIARLPTSPMNTCAGGALYQRNPRLAPTIAPQKTVNSAASGR